MSLSKNVILVSGGTGQLGRVLCRKLLSKGASVSTHYRSKVKKDDFLATISEEQRERILFSKENIFELKGARTWINTTIERFGKIHGLVHTIGGIHPKQNILDMDWQTWNDAFVLNVHSAFILAKAVLPHFIEQGHGKLIFTAALAGIKGEAGKGAYSAAKGALVRLTETLAEETKQQNIQVNAIIPSIIKTPENLKWGTPEEHARWVEPEDLAEVFAFLMSPASRAITGAIIPVTGRV